MRPTAWLCLAAALLGCNESAVEDRFIAPIDGQTAFPTTAPLYVQLGPDVLVEGQMPPEGMVVVTDLDDGTPVPGSVSQDGLGVWFFPDDPFVSGHSYAWTVNDPRDLPRQPAVKVPAHLVGTASFSTAREPVAISASLEGQQACIAVSQPLSVLQRNSLIAKVEPANETLLVSDFVPDAVDQVGPQVGEPGIDVVCLVGDDRVSAGSRIRVWIGDQGPWLLTVPERSTAEIVGELRRWEAGQ